MEEDDLDTIDAILKRHKDNSKYIEGLIKSESATGHEFTKEEIQQHRKVNQEFIKKHGLDKKNNRKKP